MIVQQRIHALGTTLLLTLVVRSEEQAGAPLAEVRAFLEAFEARFTRFASTSELSRVNAYAGEWTAVSEEFTDLLQLAMRYRKQTDGRYSPFILPALQRAGYVTSLAPYSQSSRRGVNVTARKAIADASILLAIYRAMSGRRTV